MWLNFTKTIPILIGFCVSLQADPATDLSGIYNVATLTPLERPEAFVNNLYLS